VTSVRCSGLAHAVIDAWWSSGGLAKTEVGASRCGDVAQGRCSSTDAAQNGMWHACGSRGMTAVKIPVIGACTNRLLSMTGESNVAQDVAVTRERIRSGGA